MKTLPEPQKPDVDATVEHLTGVAQQFPASVESVFTQGLATHVVLALAAL